MTEGTKSYLIGCHSFFFHPLFVIKAWHWWFGTWPKPWQIVCIFLHDIGIIGRQYLSSHEAKIGHWELGAKISGYLFGQKGAWFCAGHTPESNFPRSDLWFADKASWLVAPLWWLHLNYRLEGYKVSGPHEWRAIIARNLANGNHFGAHQLYIDEMRATTHLTTEDREMERLPGLEPGTIGLEVGSSRSGRPDE